MAAADLLMQRSPANRPRPGYAALTQGPGTPGSPHTPLLSRSLSSQFGSPGSYRVEDELVIYEVGARSLSIGFAGDPAPRAVWTFGPDSGRRAGDYGGLDPSGTIRQDALNYELWDHDLSNTDLKIVEDKLERALRVLHSKYLMLDLKNRNANLVLPPCLPNPLVELVLKSIFTGVNAPKSVYLLSKPVMAVVGAGLRSALVVDIGWHETTVTAVYEYREVVQKRTNRAGKRIAWETGRMLRSVTQSSIHSFGTIDEICRRYLWCRPSGGDQSADDGHTREVSLRLESQDTTTLPFARLADPVENSLLTPSDDFKTSDDHDRSLPSLIWSSLLSLPVDVRTICVSRIVVMGESGRLPGLKARLLHDLELIISRRAWNPVLDHGSRKGGVARALVKPVVADEENAADEEHSDAFRQAVGNVMNDADDERDEITERLERQNVKSRPPCISKSVRSVESLEAWAGASLTGHLKVEGRTQIMKDDFLKQGMSF
ncbi:hypothetical protein BDZ85DRAFT_254197 [Elsinoe ampelina]|uniref:Actin-like ATPase domain-containing protein n=1 Tax=Elsinoe ampelina TaxID=302913 RepID=A0A6A6GNP4_9PEZI|nr:hypothetical protein BDZ85DRAFT_254197 [Elsinoe ampelina]